MAGCLVFEVWWSLVLEAWLQRSLRAAEVDAHRYGMTGALTLRGSAFV
eukprot:CAMPEP_0196729198 /NCGR_PEP_ID=MMETSP1091-20130531/9660_1 /TAXON_ID=302021 /ORGANISM="Rhodomonas sp., Strain CCMP768" /LENGTH=47 /DNA_ID= /DNA_START= /DNA_END= /DNA_ORIENTATION=